MVKTQGIFNRNRMWGNHNNKLNNMYVHMCLSVLF